MGLSYNPSVVLDGLLFMLDPGNVKSYPGSGTLAYNLINSNSVNLNSVTYSSSFGGCFSFSGSNINGGDMFNLRNSIDNLSSLTVSMWFKRNRFSATTESLFSFVKNNGTHTAQIAFLSNAIYGGGRSFTDSSFQGVQSNQVFDRNKFYHVTLTMNLVSKQTRFYVDGVLIPVTGTTNYASTYFGPGAVGSATNRIGDEVNAGVAPFHGLISQVLVYGRELNPNEIYQNYNNTKGRFISTVDLPQNGLVINNDAAVPTSYPGTGVTWYSGVGVTNNSTLTNVVYNSSGYMSYDGTAYSQANIGHLGVYLQGPYSINVWAYYSSGDDLIALGSINNLHHMGVQTPGNLSVWKFGGTTLASTSLETNKWFNAVYTIDNSIIKLYYNGELRSSSVISGLSGLCDTLTTGAYSPSYSGKWQGRISNFQVYNRVLSSSEIQQSYQQIRGRYFDLPDIVRDGLQVAYDAGYVNSYPGSGTNWFDMAGNGVTGILTNGPVFVNSPDSPSIKFDATNDQVLFGTSSLVKPTRISLGCIFKINAPPTTHVIVGKQGPFTGAASYAIVIQSNGLKFRIESGGINDATYPFTNLNVYIYAMGTYDGSNLRLYINGVLVATTPFTGSIVYSDSYQLLMGYYASAFATNMNIGAMHLYNRALSDQEVLKNYRAYRGRYGL